MQDKNVKIETIVDSNGEITKERKVLLYSPFQEGKGYNFKYKSNKIESYFDIALPDDFNFSEMGRLMELSKYLHSGSNLIGKKTGARIRPYSYEEIKGIVKLKDRQCRSFLKKAEKWFIIQRVEIDSSREIHYYMNPIYFNSCKYINFNLFLIFQKSITKYLPDWVVRRFLDETN
jgi:hypothetical protein